MDNVLLPLKVLIDYIVDLTNENRTLTSKVIELEAKIANMQTGETEARKELV